MAFIDCRIVSEKARGYDKLIKVSSLRINKYPKVDVRLFILDPGNDEVPWKATRQGLMMSLSEAEAVVAGLQEAIEDVRERFAGIIPVEDLPPGTPDKKCKCGAGCLFEGEGACCKEAGTNSGLIRQNKRRG